MPLISIEERASELYDVVRGCTMCRLAETRTLAVPGEGPLNAEVMCVGEAPGMNEDKQGRPFVGAAGQFLNELLAAAGLSREQVYICNVLKCRPPANRDPLPNEIEACSEYLDLQLDIVDPLVVVTLGRFSMAKWFPQQAISRIHGSVREWDGKLIVPMYHPAAALHQGSLRQVLLDDFARLPGILERARASRRNTFEVPANPAPLPTRAEPDPPEVEQFRTPTSPTAMINGETSTLAFEKAASQFEEPQLETAPAESNDSAPAGVIEQIRLFE